jgi:hypothetical protein
MTRITARAMKNEARSFGNSRCSVATTFSPVDGSGGWPSPSAGVSVRLIERSAASPVTEACPPAVHSTVPVTAPSSL